MKNNFNSLVKFAEEIERIEDAKNDYVVPPNKLQMVNDVHLKIGSVGQFEVNNVCHGQIAEKLHIPKRYYDSMEDIPGLRTLNVNSWLKEQDEKRFIRTLDGKARAFLSDRYYPMDNYDVMTHSIFPAIEEIKKDIQFRALSMSETKMYIQFSIKTLEAEIVEGDFVRYGLTISNSEVGLGGLNAEGWIERLVCRNGMIRNSLFKKYHISRRMDSNSDIWKKDTIRAGLETYQLQLRDVIQHVLSEKTFNEEINKMKAAANDKVKDIIQTVENVTKRFDLSEKDGNAVIQNMLETGNATRWGVANGITAMAHLFENPDKQYQYEKLGSKIIDLSSNEWKVIAA